MRGNYQSVLKLSPPVGHVTWQHLELTNPHPEWMTLTFNGEKEQEVQDMQGKPAITDSLNSKSIYSQL